MKIARYILTISACLCFGISFFTGQEVNRIFRLLGYAFLISAGLSMIFSEKFGNKSSRIEIEERNF